MRELIHDYPDGRGFESLPDDAVLMGGIVFKLQLLKGRLVLNGKPRDAIVDHVQKIITIADSGDAKRMMRATALAVAETAADIEKGIV